ncbi:MAG: cell division protein FtsL [Xanthobacteraceae bacterium]
MILRIINFIVIGTLVLAAAYVYRIKYEATAQAESLARLRDEVRHKRDKIAALRAKWGELDDPARIQALAQRFLKLKEVEATQFDTLGNLPDQPPEYLRPGSKDPIGGLIDHLEKPVIVTGSVSVRPSPPSSPGGTSVQSVPAMGPPPATAPVASGANTP